MDAKIIELTGNVLRKEAPAGPRMVALFTEADLEVRRIMAHMVKANAHACLVIEDTAAFGSPRIWYENAQAEGQNPSALCVPLAAVTALRADNRTAVSFVAGQEYDVFFGDAVLTEYFYYLIFYRLNGTYLPVREPVMEVEA